MKTIKKLLIITVISLIGVLGLQGQEVDSRLQGFFYSEDPLIQSLFELIFAGAILDHVSTGSEEIWIAKLKDAQGKAKNLTGFAGVCYNHQDIKNHLDQLEDAVAQGLEKGWELVRSSTEVDEHLFLAEIFYSLERHESLICSEFEKDDSYKYMSEYCLSKYLSLCRMAKEKWEL